ncbi:Zn-ribbon domain-containing OB-fold protein [Actinomadura physcomitrii]|nr:OB-fold domain-containing protein [Actinomadura physcomitrii]
MPPLPDTTNALTEPFWAGLREHRLLVQRCAHCEALRYPAAPICPTCLTRGGDWTAVAAEGDLYSFVVYHRALSPAFAEDVPYAIGVVEIQDRLQILSRIDAPPDSLSIGTRMRARYTDVSPEVTLLHWEPAARWKGARND